MTGIADHTVELSRALRFQLSINLPSWGGRLSYIALRNGIVLHYYARVDFPNTDEPDRNLQQLGMQSIGRDKGLIPHISEACQCSCHRFRSGKAADLSTFPMENIACNYLFSNGAQCNAAKCMNYWIG